MEEVYRVKFKNDPKIVICVSDKKLKEGDFVVVETSLGCEGGEIVSVEKKTKDNSKELFSITRKITEEERDEIQMSEEERRKYLKIFSLLSKKHNLPMKVISADFCIDKKIIFTFSAENRVDFREFVKELTKKLDQQVILKQIGSRDCARAIDGFGPCGRRICCRQFLGVQDGVSMDMARLQGMSGKGTAKISGCCGRLMCCLKFENECYKKTLAKMPKFGDKIKTPEGQGSVVSVNLVTEKIEVELPNKTRMEISL